MRVEPRSSLCVVDGSFRMALVRAATPSLLPYPSAFPYPPLLTLPPQPHLCCLLACLPANFTSPTSQSIISHLEPKHPAHSWLHPFQPAHLHHYYPSPPSLFFLLFFLRFFLFPFFFKKKTTHILALFILSHQWSTTTRKSYIIPSFPLPPSSLVSSSSFRPLHFFFFWLAGLPAPKLLAPKVVKPIHQISLAKTCPRHRGETSTHTHTPSASGPR